MAADLSALSTEDLVALKAGDLTKVSTAGLQALKDARPSAVERVATDPITQEAQKAQSYTPAELIAGSAPGRFLLEPARGLLELGSHFGLPGGESAQQTGELIKRGREAYGDTGADLQRQGRETSGQRKPSKQGRDWGSDWPSLPLVLSSRVLATRSTEPSSPLSLAGRRRFSTASRPSFSAPRRRRSPKPSRQPASLSQGRARRRAKPCRLSPKRVPSRPISKL